MIGTFVYLPALWPPLATAILVVILGIYSWRRRAVPGARYFAGACVLWSLALVGIAAETAAVDLTAQLAWHTYQALWQLPIVTAMTCFSLEYVQPGRWLTRRNLILLAVPPLLAALLILTNPAHHLFWRGIIVDEGIRAEPAPGGWLAIGYGILLTVLQAAALVWLFVRSPQHRWPVALMLAALILTRALFLRTVVGPNPTAPLDSGFVLVLLPVVTYAIALFGFHIFDPLPAARQAVLEQMSTGVIVFDAHWRVVSLNLAAERMLGLHSAAARKKRWQELAPAAPPLPVPGELRGDTAEMATEFTHHGHDGMRRYAPALSQLRDFRGMLMGYLLLLRDVTEQCHAQAQIVEQQRSLAALHERELLARDLHDSIGQVLGYASMQVDATSQLIDDGQTAAAGAQLTRLAAVLQDAHADVREQILQLRAAPSPQQPFFAAVRSYLDGYASNYAIGAQLTVNDGLCPERITPEAQMQLFRILQEALSNARKHSCARCVEVSFAAENGTLHMGIADNGCGFDQARRWDAEIIWAFTLCASGPKHWVAVYAWHRHLAAEPASTWKSHGRSANMRVLLADDHRLLVEGLSNLLVAHGIDVVGVAADGREAVFQALALDPDVILMDLRMPVCAGLTATRLIKAQRPAIQIVILTTSAEDQDLFAAIQSGACGYLLKSISGKTFIEALRGLEEGAPPFSPGLAARLLAEFARLAGQPPPGPTLELAAADTLAAAVNAPEDLTERQIEVLRLVASGLTYKEVGQRLGLSERTVRYHMAEIMARLHLEHRSQVIAYAGQSGITTSP